jgi:ferric-dicitrate binding protein FerR (iron transport regulator)
MAGWVVLAAGVGLQAQQAQTMGTAVVTGTGEVYVDGAQLTAPSLAVTVGDVIQTREAGAASISGQGSSAVVDANSIVRYEAEGFALDRGSVSVATSRQAEVFALDLQIVPSSAGFTEFYVTRSGGTIGILARKNNVTVSCGGNTTVVKEGQQISRADTGDCGVLAAKGGGAPTAAHGAILSGRSAELGALAAGGVLAGWALIHDDDPVSPDKP